MRVALAGPVPPVRSGIADFVLELLPALARRFELTLLVDGVRPSDEVRRSGVAIAELGSREGRSAAERADLLLVELGNDPIHARAYDFGLALRKEGRPVVFELHEIVLGHFAAARWLEGGDRERYVEEARIGHGAEGERIARVDVLEKGLGIWDLDPWRLPMSGRAIREASGVVVHSRFARRKVWGNRPEVPVAVIPHAALPPEGFPERKSARTSLGLPEGRLVLTSTGFVVPAKRLDAVLEALARQGPEVDWTLRICGEPVAGDPLRGRARELGIDGRVVFTGWLSWERLLAEMAATDLLVNLREPTLGESSGSVARILSAGVPAVVSDVGWYSEIPADCAFRVPPGEGTVPGLALLLGELAADPERRRRVGAAAAAFARREWSIDRIADLYLRELPRLARGSGAADRLEVGLGLAAASLGWGDLDPRLGARLEGPLELVLGRRGDRR